MNCCCEELCRLSSLCAQLFSLSLSLTRCLSCSLRARIVLPNNDQSRAGPAIPCALSGYDMAHLFYTSCPSQTWLGGKRAIEWSNVKSCSQGGREREGGRKGERLWRRFRSFRATPKHRNKQNVRQWQDRVWRGDCNLHTHTHTEREREGGREGTMTRYGSIDHTHQSIRKYSFNGSVYRLTEIEAARVVG